MDRILDQDPGRSHEFLAAVEKLVSLKHENPSVRLGGANNPLKREEVKLSENETTGVRGPKRKFMHLETIFIRIYHIDSLTLTFFWVKVKAKAIFHCFVDYGFCQRRLRRSIFPTYRYRVRRFSRTCLKKYGFSFS